MAFAKTPTKVTTIKEYGTTHAPDSAYPASSKTTQNNNTTTDTYIPTGDYKDSLSQNSQEQSADSKQPSSNSNKSLSGFKFYIEIIAALIAFGGVAWLLSKVDSKIDNVDNKIEAVAKDVEKNASKIEGLKESVSEIFFKVKELEQKNSQKNTNPEVSSK